MLLSMVTASCVVVVPGVDTGILWLWVLGCSGCSRGYTSGISVVARLVKGMSKGHVKC